MHPVLIPGIWKIPALHTYGLMIAIAFLVGMQLGLREARRIDTTEERNFDQFINDLCFWILVSAMVGARLLFIIVNWEDDYARNPIKIIQIWKGGLVFFGGLLGAIAFSVYYSKKHGHSFLMVADTLIPSVALGQFFGRIGCFAAGCCWGQPVSASHPFAVQFPSQALAWSGQVREGLIGADATHTLHVHPVQLYESASMLLVFFGLLLMRTKKRIHGQVLATYLFVYPIIRYTLEEYFRGDTERGTNVAGLGLSTSQVVALGLLATAVTLTIYMIRKFRSTNAAQAA